MGKITGLGGIFTTTKDPKSLPDWYQQNLDIHFNGNSYVDLPFTGTDGKLTPGYNVLSFSRIIPRILIQVRKKQ